MPHAKLSVQALAFGLAVLVASSLPAAPNRDQLTKVRSADDAITKAGRLFGAKKFRESGEAIKEAQATVTALINDKDNKEVLPALKPLMDKLSKAHGLLELEGVALTPLPKLPEPAPTATTTAAKPGTPAAPAATNGEISFAKDVAPLLSSKCGRCHVLEMKGEFSMANYDMLMKGNKDGLVILPGKGTSSRIIEVIASGDMPRGGGALTNEQLAMVTKWIDQGAKFDGDKKSDPLGDYARDAMRDRPKLEVAQASGSEKVLFARDIAPVIQEKCINCHGARQPKGMLGMVSFDRLMRGGESGPLLVPGKPAESLLIKKLKGVGGKQMPPKGGLAADVIAKFETWVAEGAKFDGTDRNMDLEELILLMKAIRATHPELAELRSGINEGNWRLVIPDATPSKQDTEHFQLYGNVSPEVLEDVAKTGEAQVEMLTKLFKAPSSSPFIKGKMTLFVFDKRYDYGEIGQQLERREIPKDWRGHWRYTIVEAYGALLPSRGSEYSLPALVAQQVAGVHVATLAGKPPRWFSEGTARAVAAKVDSKDPRVRAWDDALSGSLQRGTKPDSFLTGGMPAEDADIVSYAFVRGLMGNAKSYQALIDALRAGTPFDSAFKGAFGGTPNQLAASWGGRASASTTGGKKK